jgi:hypothetical protein
VPILGTIASSFDNTVAARGLFGGGYATSPGVVNVIDYVEIASTGNATDFGDLTQARDNHFGNVSSTTRGLHAGGTAPSYVNTIDYITIATTGNATDFGDLAVAVMRVRGCSSPTRAVFGGGEASSGYVATMNYVTIATTGNTTNFGKSKLKKQIKNKYKTT